MSWKCKDFDEGHEPGLEFHGSQVIGTSHTCNLFCRRFGTCEEVSGSPRNSGQPLQQCSDPSTVATLTVPSWEARLQPTLPQLSCQQWRWHLQFPALPPGHALALVEMTTNPCTRSRFPAVLATRLLAVKTHPTMQGTSCSKHRLGTHHPVPTSLTTATEHPPPLKVSRYRSEFLAT